MSAQIETPQILLAHHLKRLKLPTFLREYDKLAKQAASEGLDHPRYLLRLAELELIDRERRLVERRIRAARFSAVKSLEAFDFAAIPSLNKLLVLELARCEFIAARENVVALGNSGTGKTHICLALGAAACQRRQSRQPIDGSARRKEALAPAAEPRFGPAPHRRRIGLCAALASGRRIAVRGLLPALRTRLDRRHLQSAVRGLDERVRIGAPHRRAARPAHSPRPHPRTERRELSPQTIRLTPRAPCKGVRATRTSRRRLRRRNPQRLTALAVSSLEMKTAPYGAVFISLRSVPGWFFQFPMVGFSNAVDKGARALGLQDEIGTLEVGKAADLAIWDIKHPAELSYWLGAALLRERVFAGSPDWRIRRPS